MSDLTNKEVNPFDGHSLIDEVAGIPKDELYFLKENGITHVKWVDKVLEASRFSGG